MGAQLYCFILLAVRRPPPCFFLGKLICLCTSSRRLWQASFVGFTGCYSCKKTCLPQGDEVIAEIGSSKVIAEIGYREVRLSSPPQVAGLP